MTKILKRSLKRSAIAKLRSRSGSPIIFQMAIGIGIAIAIFGKDRDRDRDLNVGDWAHALVITSLIQWDMVFSTWELKFPISWIYHVNCFVWHFSEIFVKKLSEFLTFCDSNNNPEKIFSKFHVFFILMAYMKRKKKYVRLKRLIDLLWRKNVLF